MDHFPKIYISCGAGVQSSTMAIMSSVGEIPVADAAIFADTGDEPDEVYRWLEYLKGQLSFPLHTVSAGNLMEDQLKRRVSGRTGNVYFRQMIPAFVSKDSGGKALLGRRCTADYKVRPIISMNKKLAGPEAMKAWKSRHKDDYKSWLEYERLSKGGGKAPFPFDAFRRMQEDPLVIQYIGISLDESKRMKRSQLPWARAEWPLISKRMTRDDCISWMKSHGHPEPPRSACKKCPFHSDHEWARQKELDPKAWKESVEYDKTLRDTLSTATGSARIRGDVFLHSSLVPLDEVDFGAASATKKDIQMNFLDECEGLCGV